MSNYFNHKPAETTTCGNFLLWRFLQHKPHWFYPCHGMVNLTTWSLSEDSLGPSQPVFSPKTLHSCWWDSVKPANDRKPALKRKRDLKSRSAWCYVMLCYFKIFILTRERKNRSRESSRGRDRSRLPTEQRARCGTRSQHPGIMTRAEGTCLTRLSHPGIPIAGDFSTWVHFMGSSIWNVLEIMWNLKLRFPCYHPLQEIYFLFLRKS